MSMTRLRTVKLLSEITEDYFYLENLIEKLGMNKATDSKALKNTLEQASISFNVDSAIPAKCQTCPFKKIRLGRPSDFSRTAPTFGCNTLESRK